MCVRSYEGWLVCDVISATRKCRYRVFISCVMSDEFWVISPTSPKLFDK